VIPKRPSAIRCSRPCASASARVCSSEGVRSPGAHLRGTSRGYFQSGHALTVAESVVKARIPAAVVATLAPPPA